MAPPINPPTHQTIHPPIGGRVSTDFKSSNRIKNISIPSRVIEFLLIWVVPLGGGGSGWGVKWGFEDDRDGMGMTGTTWGRWGRNGEDGKDTSIMINMLVAICNILHVCVHACVHVHACAHVWGHPPSPPPPTCPLPRVTGSPKHQNSITLELIKII